MEKITVVKESENPSDDKKLIKLLKDNGYEAEIVNDTSQVEKNNSIVGQAAHDLRAPINAINGFCNILIEDIKELSSNEMIEMLNIIHDRCDFMGELIEQTLGYSQINTEKTLKRKDVNLNDYIRKQIGYFKTYVSKRNIKIDYQSDYDGKVNIDQMKYEQVVTNIISNSLKFSPENTTIKINVSKSNKVITCTVTDHGQGVRESEIRNLFIPFKNTSNKTLDGTKSFGLGLSISKTIIEAHGGEIEVKSKVGEGTQISFTIPLS